MTRISSSGPAAELAIRPLAAEFADARIERAYRHWIWPEATSVLRLGAILFTSLYWIVLLVDVRFVGLGGLFAIMVGLRLAVTFGAVRLIMTSFDARFVGLFPARYIQAVIATPFVVAGIVVTRPADFTFYSVSHIAFIIGVYLVTPFRLSAIASILIASSITEIGLRIAIGSAPAAFLLPLSLGFVLAQFAGYATARRANIMRRREFQNRLTERRIRRELMRQQKALTYEIQERKRAESALIAAKHEADSANNAKTAFLAAMSHDIRTPLTGILGFAQLLSESELNPDQRAQLKIIEQSGRTLTRLLSDILDLSKIEAGRIAIENAPFDLIHSLNTTIRLAEARAKSRAAAIRFIHGKGLNELWFRGDSARLEQIVGNLLENAIKYAPEGDIDIILEAGRGGGLCPITIAVADRGPGVPDDLKAAIFEPYVLGQARAAHGGFGLGLAICRRLAEAMGGTITLEDRPGGGSIFSVTLTLEQSSREALAAGDRPAAAVGLEVLLVDDDEVNRLLITTVITRLGHRVESAVDGREGVERALGRRFDVVLMDMRMPVMDGMAAIAALRASANLHAKGLPIIALTADVMDQDIERYRRAGADDVIAKPIDFKLLEDKLARLASAKAQLASR